MPDPKINTFGFSMLSMHIEKIMPVIELSITFRLPVVNKILSQSHSRLWCVLEFMIAVVTPRHNNVLIGSLSEKIIFSQPIVAIVLSNSLIGL